MIVRNRYYTKNLNRYTYLEKCFPDLICCSDKLIHVIPSKTRAVSQGLDLHV